MQDPTLYHISTSDNCDLAVWHYIPEVPINKHVFITHGTFSNKNACDGLATYLAHQGYSIWLMEWRNHGDSSQIDEPYSFEIIALQDIATTFTYLRDEEGIEEIHAIAHSGGGIALTMFLIHHTDLKNMIKSITFFGVQVYGAGSKLYDRLSIFVVKWLSACRGRVPARLAGARDHDESYYFMKQWYNWNLRKNFIGNDGFDYKPRMKEIQIPVLSICAKGDNLIAPKVGCQMFLDDFENPDNKLSYFALEEGSLEDYDHSRILKSQNAKIEIWPQVVKWFQQHS